MSGENALESRRSKLTPTCCFKDRDPTLKEQLHLSLINFRRSRRNEEPHNNGSTNSNSKSAANEFQSAGNSSQNHKVHQKSLI